MHTKTREEVSLNPAIRALVPSATLAINERSLALIKAGKKVFRFGFGQSPFPVPEEVVKELKKHAREKDYLPVKGLWALREAVAKFHQRTQGLQFSAGDILIGPGSKELIFNLQLAFDGDILLPSPSWVSYEPQARISGKKVHWIDTQPSDKWCLTPKALENICRKLTGRRKFLLLNYPNNPSGTTYTADQLKALAAIAREHKLLILADEIYGEVHHDGAHHSIAEFYPEGTIISGGLSKWCGAGGWRLGTMAFPSGYLWLQDAVAIIASETYTSVSAPVQYAAVRAFADSPAIGHYLNSCRNILKGVGNYVFSHLNSCYVKMPAPEGGFYLFPSFDTHKDHLKTKGIYTSTDFCERLLEDTGVALLPGIAFGRPAEELTTRLSFVDFSGNRALKAVSGKDPILHPMKNSFKNIAQTLWKPLA